MTEKIEGFYLDGTEYEIGGAEYNAGEGIEIKNGLDYSAMQGPAPDGFHVPFNTEWQAVYDIWTALGGGSSSGTNFGIALKLPFAGYRYRGNSNVGGQDYYGDYWSSTRFNEEYAYCLDLSSSSIFPKYIDGDRANGHSIRCFKNSPTVPTSSWIKLYGTSIEAGGIFWSSTDGLISLSSDGQTWITIADKNLGATTVWNSGDTLSEANAGKYYQRGNNYGFPRTGSVTTSSTQVDASAYGPGNYYSSSTFITRSSSPRRWDTTDNGNLWGGVTGVVTDAITNTGVLSVNGQTGDVTIQTGGNYTAGNGIDITNDEIGLDGTYETTDYSAMQGPAPSGFHVPLTTEWQAVYNIWTALGGGSNDGPNFGIALKLPFAGYRYGGNTNVVSSGAQGYYWSSSHNNNARAYNLYFYSTSIYPQANNYRANGHSIRCFKNSPTVPTSSWIKLYGTSIEAGGIFWSSTDGLISLSSDGQTWVTIADKNLGATTVWNSGDTLSEANCGYFYQWGNNYGFPLTGTIANQSTTQVDASNYGPGNYYSSDTFIKREGRWDTTDNGNLRGGETGVQIVSGNLAIGDKLYKIVTSTSAPASGTASNIITIVTD